MAGVDAGIDLGDGGVLADVRHVVRIGRGVAEVLEQHANHVLEGLREAEAGEAVLRDQVVGEGGFAAAGGGGVDADKHGQGCKKVGWIKTSIQA